MENLASRHQHLFTENFGKTKKIRNGLRLEKKGFRSRLRTGKVLAAHVSVMKMTTFNRVR